MVRSKLTFVFSSSPLVATFVCTFADRSCTCRSVVYQQIELLVSQQFLGSLCGTQSRGRGWFVVCVFVCMHVNMYNRLIMQSVFLH